MGCAAAAALAGDGSALWHGGHPRAPGGAKEESGGGEKRIPGGCTGGKARLRLSSGWENMGSG